MAHATKSLIFFLADYLSSYSEDFVILKRANPVEFRLNGQNYVVHVSSVHDSGEGRADDDEERIQISTTNRLNLANKAQDGYRIAFIGFFPMGGVFTAWEPSYVFSLQAKTVGSVYARLSHHELALNFGAAARAFQPRYLPRPSMEVALRSEALGFYLENLEALHSVATEAEIRAAIALVSRDIESEQKTGADEVEVEIGGERKIVTVTRTSYRRDPKFRDAVMRAYDGRCCVCNRQLGLVEAAHIVPHGNPESIDHVTNGLALCVEHHRLYDSVLLIPDSGRNLFLNPDRVEHLRNIGQDAGLDAIEQLANQQYRIPDHAPSRPNDDLLTRGKAIRLG